MSMRSLEASNVAIVGGTSGIGQAVAAAALSAGASVTILGRSEDKLRQAAQTLGDGVNVAVLDALDTVQAAAAFERIGNIDHLILTAGGDFGQGPLTEIGLSTVMRVFEAKFGAQTNAVIAAAPYLTATASVTLTSGAYGRAVAPGAAALAATNTAIEAVAKVLARELAPRRVNVICPGLVETPAYDAMSSEARRGMMEAASEALPVGRVGTVDDLAMAYLAAMTNGYQTGAVIDVDGGAQIA